LKIAKGEKQAKGGEFREWFKTKTGGGGKKGRGDRRRGKRNVTKTEQKLADPHVRKILSIHWENQDGSRGGGRKRCRAVIEGQHTANSGNEFSVHAT